MTKELLTKMEEAVDFDNFFDFIQNNYYKMSQEDLKQIILEMDWYLYCYKDNKEAEISVLKSFQEDLDD